MQPPGTHSTDVPFPFRRPFTRFVLASLVGLVALLVWTVFGAVCDSSTTPSDKSDTLRTTVQRDPQNICYVALDYRTFRRCSACEAGHVPLA